MTLEEFIKEHPNLSGQELLDKFNTQYNPLYKELQELVDFIGEVSYVKEKEDNTSIYRIYNPVIEGTRLLCDYTEIVVNIEYDDFGIWRNNGTRMTLNKYDYEFVDKEEWDKFHNTLKSVETLLIKHL